MDNEKDNSSSDQAKNADSLQEQIEDLVAGRAKPVARKSLRDFLADKMARDKETEGTSE
jgi:hypothetical protein